MSRVFRKRLHNPSRCRLLGQLLLIGRSIVGVPVLRGESVAGFWIWLCAARISCSGCIHYFRERCDNAEIFTVGVALAVAAVGVLATLWGTTGPARAQGGIAPATGTAPQVRVADVPGAPGTVVLRWNGGHDASFYRVGYVDGVYVPADDGTDDEGRLDDFYFVDFRNRGQTERRIENLRPRGSYTFVVAPLGKRFGPVDTGDWSEFVPHTLTVAAGKPCPSPPPLPPRPGELSPTVAVNGGELSPTDVANGGEPSPTDVANGVDYDSDDNGLIEVANLGQLNAMRHDLDGDGRGLGSNYVAAFSNARPGMGCPEAGCVGYELIADLDFDTNGDGGVDGRDDYWTDGLGWRPIGGPDKDVAWNAVFDGGGHAIANLFVAADGMHEAAGLFGVIAEGGEVSNVSLTSVSVSGPTVAGGLAGISYGAVHGVSVAGEVFATNVAGGLIGAMWGGATVADSNAAVDVSGTEAVGGLVGLGYKAGGVAPRIESSYATGDVGEGPASDSRTELPAAGPTAGPAGGLVGEFAGEVRASYATGAVSVGGNNRCGNPGGDCDRVGDAGGLVGILTGSVIAGYATGPVDGFAAGGGLLGVCYRCRIADSYAAGLLTDRGGYVGGLVGLGSGRGANRPMVTDGFWDTESSGMTRGTLGIGKTTREMQGAGIYSGWNPDWWDFGTEDQYPALKYGGMGLEVQRR